MALFKLAIKNVQNQLRHYFMYFISMAFSVMIYYSFIAISHEKNLVQQVEYNDYITSGLKSAGAVIILFIVVFMLSANNFFINVRQNEIGLYNLLGMRKRQISSLFFFENLLLGGSALGLGIILGILMSKFFSMILIKFMDLQVDTGFSFSLRAIQETVFIFIGILLIVSIRSGSQVYRYQLVDLFKGDTKGEQQKKVTFKTWFTGILGIFLLGFGYYQATRFLDFVMDVNYQIRSEFGFFYAALLILFSCIIGTYLFFHSFLFIVLSTTQKFKGYYYRELNMMTVSNVSFHLKRNANTLSTIAVLAGTTIAAIGGATSLGSFSLETIQGITPTDYVTTQEPYLQIKSVIDETKGFSIVDDIKIPVKYTGIHIERELYSEEYNYTGQASIISLTDYEKMRQYNYLLKKLDLSNDNDVVIFEVMGGVALEDVEYLINKLQIKNLPQIYHITSYHMDHFGGASFNGNVRLNGPLIVVREEVFPQIEADATDSLHFITIDDKRDKSILEQQMVAKVPKTSIVYEGDYWQNKDGEVTGKMKKVENEGMEPKVPIRQHENYLSRFPLVKDTKARYGLIIYIALFLGIVFLIATGSIIMLKQLSEAENEKNRYQLLRKLGVQEDVIKKSIYKQNLVIFFLPLIIAMLHAHFALKAYNFMIAAKDNTMTYLAFSFLLCIYLLFYFATTSTYYKIIKE